MHQINFFDELKDRFVEKKEAMLSYYMLPNGDDAKWQIFLEYYENVSMTIEEDDYFEYLLNNTWNLGLITK